MVIVQCTPQENPATMTLETGDSQSQMDSGVGRRSVGSLDFFIFNEGSWAVLPRPTAFAARLISQRNSRGATNGSTFIFSLLPSLYAICSVSLGVRVSGRSDCICSANCDGSHCHEPISKCSGHARPQQGLSDHAMPEMLETRYVTLNDICLGLC